MRPKPTVTKSASNAHAGGLARHEDEGKLHQPSHHECGGERAGRDAEDGGGQPDQEIFQGISGESAALVSPPSVLSTTAS